MNENTMQDILRRAVDKNCSDIHITVGVPPMCRLDGQILSMEGYPTLTAQDTEDLCVSILSPEQLNRLKENGETDFSYSIAGVCRFRVNVYMQRGTYTAALRVLAQEVPTLDSLNMPPVLKELALRPHGIILVTGPTGSGKSTTLAAMIDYINNNRRGHILTLEDPIEYLHRHKRCIVNQREMGEDSKAFINALRAALREDPDVLLIGEMRDLETVSTAISAAETGHLVLSTLHTINASQTVDRIIDMFPPFQQQQIRTQLAGTLVGVISQQLMRLMGSPGRIAAQELLIVNDAVRNVIREGKTHQIPSMMQTGINQGMMPMDYALSRLVKERKITLQDATINCFDVDMLRRYLA